jgi:two-component system response regulator AtoC
MNSQKTTILIVDDELSIRESFSLILEDKYRIMVAASGEASLKKLVDEKVDLVYLDIRMPGMDGMETLKRMKEIDRDVTVVMVTAVNDVQKAGEAIKLGAEDYLIKPFDVKEILGMTERNIRRKNLSRQTREMQISAQSLEDAELLGTAREIDEIRKIVDDISDKNLNVVISGERGVEKELLAAIIHNVSSRGAGPFCVLSTSGKSPEALRSKLFGSGKGSSASTLEKEKGALERASSGTLFLTDIENLPQSLQKELLSTLEKKEIKREGSLSSIPVDVRVICGAGSNPKDLVSKGRLDKPLYEELSKALIEIPPLRRRASDIPILADHFVRKFNKRHGKDINGFTGDALETLSGYQFPGNVTELENMIENIVLTFEGREISSTELPVSLLASSKTFKDTDEGRKLSIESSYENLERQCIEHSIDATGSDLSKAAELLGLSDAALRAKIESLNIKK